MLARKQIGAIATVTPVWFLAVYLVMSSLRPEYSHLTKAISELGSLDAQNMWAWNILGYILPGLAIALLAIGLKREFSDSGRNIVVPSMALVASGLFMAMSGIFPGDFVNRTSTTMFLHTVGSLGSFVVFLVAGFWLPTFFRSRPAWLRFESRARSESTAPVLASHFAKYPRMIAVIALITHLLDGGVGPISVKATIQASAWAAILEKHTIRIYSQATNQNVAPAYALSQALLSNRLEEGFTARKVQRKGWRNLTSTDQVYAAIDQLVEQGWLRGEVRKSEIGGRSTTIYLINPGLDRRGSGSIVSAPEIC